MDEQCVARERLTQAYQECCQVKRLGTMRRDWWRVLFHIISTQGLLLLLLGLSLTGCSYSWHQKMTVEVDVNGQAYIGSSVVGISVLRHPDFLPIEGSYDTEMRGEAVVVGLPQQQYLFALVKGQEYLARRVFYDKLAGKFSGTEWLHILSNMQEKREVVPKDYPLLVTFTDINDPKTVKQVDPDNLEATFGPGVSLKRITLTITDEPVTEGRIESVLGWWNSEKPLQGPKWDWKHPEFNYENRLLKRYFKEK